MEKAVALGFPNGCDSITVGRVRGSLPFAVDKEKGKDQPKFFNLIAGISKSHAFYIYNLDNSVMWTMYFPQVQPIMLDTLITQPDWSYPKKLLFLPYKPDNKLHISLTQILLETHCKDMYSQSLNTDFLHTVYTLFRYFC